MEYYSATKGIDYWYICCLWYSARYLSDSYFFGGVCKSTLSKEHVCIKTCSKQMFITELFIIVKGANNPDVHQLNRWTTYGLSIQWKVLFHYKEEWSDSCDNVDEPQEHYAQWKEWMTNDHILYDSITVKCPE